METKKCTVKVLYTYFAVLDSTATLNRRSRCCPQCRLVADNCVLKSPAGNLVRCHEMS